MSLPHHERRSLALRVVLAALILGAAFASSLARATPLRIEWLPPEGAPAPSAADAATRDGWVAVDAGRVQRYPRNPHGVWLRITALDAGWPRARQALVVHQPGVGDYRLHVPGEAPRRGALEDLPGAQWRGNGALAFPIETLPADRSPLMLWLAPHGSIGAAIRLELQPLHTALAADAGRVALLSAVFTALLATAAIALVFAVVLRDRTFLYYACYTVGFAVLQGVQTGFAFRPLGMAWLATDPVVWARAGAACSVLFAALFARQFAGLGHYAPRLGRAAVGVGAAFFVIFITSLVPSDAVRVAAGVLQNPLVILAGPLLLAATAQAWWRGSRYAAWFLLGWGPLVVLTVLTSVQHFGPMGTWTWLPTAALVAAGFEAIVLSLGLAERAVGERRAREHDRRLAETDPLTGVLNRRALLARLEVLMGDARAQPLSVLFLDLDHFKRLNDTFGHRAGDHALTRVVRSLESQLRPGDLLGRYGGEEFLIALPGMGAADAVRMAERLRVRVGEDCAGARESASITVSIGVATHRARLAPTSGLPLHETLVDLIDRADRSLYAAKTAGRNRVWTETVGAVA